MTGKKEGATTPGFFANQARVDFLLNKVHQKRNTKKELAELMEYLTPAFGEMAGDFIETSHTNYGKPDKDGLITIH